MSAILEALRHNDWSWSSNRLNTPCHPAYRERQCKKRTRCFPVAFGAASLVGSVEAGEPERDHPVRISGADGLPGGPSDPRNLLSCIRKESRETHPIP